MKKLLALAGIALIAAACTNNDEPVQECGQINLTLENSTAPEIEVSTRTVTDLTRMRRTTTYKSSKTAM